MRIEVFCLCDAATVEAGKLNLLGAFDTIGVVSVPSVHPQCAVALRVRFDQIERGEHNITVNIVDSDGKNIISPAQGKITVNVPDEQRSVAANLILNIHGLKFQSFGEHAIDLAIDGRHEASLPLWVKERKL